MKFMSDFSGDWVNLEVVHEWVRELNILRAHYLNHGDGGPAQGVLAALALIEDSGVDRWGTMTRWQPTSAPVDDPALARTMKIGG